MYRTHYARVAVDAVCEGIIRLSQLNIGHIFQPHFLTRGQGGNDYVFEFGEFRLAACIS